MSENRLYDSLLVLPLFLGMNRSDLQAAAGSTRFDFKKIESGETIVCEGDVCQRLYFLINGETIVITEADDHGYRIEEDIMAPEIFQPERLFGLTQRFTHTYVAKTNCSLMSISKQELANLSDNFEIFRINLLNMISTQTQKNNRHKFRVPPKNLPERIIRFFESHCIRPAGEKTFYIKMARLAEELNTKRIYISQALHELQSHSLVNLSRGKIEIPALEKLINH